MENKSVAWKSGYNCAASYGALLNNPFAKNTPEYKQWRQGFMKYLEEIKNTN